MAGWGVSRVRYRHVAIVLVYLLVGTAAALDRDHLVNGMHGLTQGHRAADVTAGVLAVWGPLILLIVAGMAAGRAAPGIRRFWWVVPLLWLPTLALTPYSRFGTDRPLQGELQERLPGFLTGLVVGVAVLALPVLVLGLALRWRQRSTARDTDDGSLRPGDRVVFTGVAQPGSGPNTGDLGVVRRLDGDDVVADWPSGRAKVPLINIRSAGQQ